MIILLYYLFIIAHHNRLSLLRIVQWAVNVQCRTAGLGDSHTPRISSFKVCKFPHDVFLHRNVSAVMKIVAKFVRVRSAGIELMPLQVFNLSSSY